VKLGNGRESRKASCCSSLWLEETLSIFAETRRGSMCKLWSKKKRNSSQEGETSSWGCKGCFGAKKATKKQRSQTFAGSLKCGPRSGLREGSNDRRGGKDIAGRGGGLRVNLSRRILRKKNEKHQSVLPRKKVTRTSGRPGSPAFEANVVRLGYQYLAHQALRDNPKPELWGGL